MYIIIIIIKYERNYKNLCESNTYLGEEAMKRGRQHSSSSV